MLRALRKLLVWSLLASAVWWLWPAGELRHEPGVRLDREPEQQTIAPLVVANFKKYTITAVAAYAIEARVLHTKRYWADGEDLVPYDVAVGWGAMSDQAVLDQLSISQGNRFFFYEWQNPPPIAVSEIECHAANMHVIAANKDVAKAVKHLRRGEFVAMRGYLVNVGGPDGFYLEYFTAPRRYGQRRVRGFLRGVSGGEAGAATARARALSCLTRPSELPLPTAGKCSAQGAA